MSVVMVQLGTEIDDTSDEDEEPNECDDLEEQPYDKFKHMLLLFVVFWQFAFNISNTAITSLLKFL